MELATLSRKRKQMEQGILDPKRPSETCFIDNIPDSLLIEILLRLPFQTAKHCTLVCKRWCALLSDPYFASRFRHLNNNFRILFSFENRNNINRFLLATSPTESFFRSRRDFSLSCLPCYNYREPAIAVAHCKDLLLCCPKFRSHYVYFICNPLTQKWIQLPPPHPPSYLTIRIGFICEGQGSSFGYAVVRIPFSDVHRFPSEFKVQTFSSDTGRWTEKIVSSAPQIFGWIWFNNGSGVPYNGLLFWITFSHQLIGLDPFNRGECRLLIDLPSGSSLKSHLCLAVCRGVLRLLEVEDNFIADVVTIRVWDLNHYKMGKWCLEHDIRFSGLRSNSGSSHWFKLKDDDHYRPRIILPFALACDPNDADIVYLLIDCTVVSCNMRTQTLSEMCCNDVTTNFNCIGSVFTYVLPWLPTPIPHVSHWKFEQYKPGVAE